LSDNPVTLSTAATSPVEIIEMPVTDPESPAYFALAKANEKVDPDILEKRVRIGKAKLGRTKYKTTKQRFKKPHGNEINDQHEQYALTYGMMCGILNSAGLQNPFKQRLTMDDFMRVDKKEFPANSKLQHPFKFKDYSPDIFRQIRRRFCIDNVSNLFLYNIHIQRSLIPTYQKTVLG
jgi:1-phosphatidylinositol-4-phosphate 5-kinase